MLRLEDIHNNSPVAGLEPGQVVRTMKIKYVDSESLTVHFKMPDEWLGDMMPFRGNEEGESIANSGHPRLSRLQEAAQP